MMTALLIFKQKVKSLYSDVEIFLLPVLKFVLAFIFFSGINDRIGYLDVLNNTFIVLIGALLCAVLPVNVTVYVGFAMMIAHCYAVSLECALFMAVLLLFMLSMFMRFSRKYNIMFVFAQILFRIKAPALLPIGAGLAGDITACLPAGCGVIIYYFMNDISNHIGSLQSTNEQEIFVRMQTLLDSCLLSNREMWITVIAVAIVSILVSLLRRSSFDYAWRIAIIMGGVIYISVIFGGSLVMDIDVDIASLMISTVVSVIIGIVLEFFFFGGDYTRVEKLMFEDDDYYYYVKAVPKAAITVKSRSIKKINGGSMDDEEKKNQEYTITAAGEVEVDPQDFEKKLEESLRDL